MRFRRLLHTLLQFLYCSMAFTATEKPADSKKINQVIYLTLDGVRWQDVYQSQQYFPKFWQKHANQFTLYGKPSDAPMVTAAVPTSLPSYQCQMAGKVQPCTDNDCGRIKVETLPESLIRRLYLPKKKVAVFSSWGGIANAVEHIKGTVFSNNSYEPVYDPDTLKPDPVMSELNKKQRIDIHPVDNRYDRYTFEQAWHYYITYKPVFLWISLVDSDAAAHENDLKGYHQTLSYYDEILDNILNYLQKNGLDKHTLLIVTTDHGRGDGPNWIDHGPEYPESKNIWAFVMNGELIPVSQNGEKEHYSLLSIRPTIEKALGLIP